MKKAADASDKLRAIEKNPELRALMERYDAASPDKRAPILKGFIEKASALHPDWRETTERSRREGLVLRALFIHSLQDARARPNLSAFEQRKIKNLEAEFVGPFDAFLAVSPAVREAAFRLASATQQMEMIARFGLEEAEKRKRRAISEGGRKGGKNRWEGRTGENRPWVPHATELAHVIYSEFPGASDQEIAVEIKTRWKLDCPLPPTVRTLEKFVSELRPLLPKRAK
jgi:hypothetical protein